MRIRNLLPEAVRRGTDEDYPFYSLQKEMNSLFDNFVRGFDISPRAFFNRGERKFTPSVDVKETDEAFDIKAELPGVDEKDIEVTVTNDSITIKGEKKEKKEEKRKNYYYMERSYGSFNRIIPLSSEAESSKAEARFKNGVLDITIPKSMVAKAKETKVAIKSA